MHHAVMLPVMVATSSLPQPVHYPTLCSVILRYNSVKLKADLLPPHFIFPQADLLPPQV